MSLFRRRRWCYGMIYWRCYSSHKCTIVYVQQWNISFRIKKNPPPLLQSPHPTVTTKRKRRRKWALMERSLLFFFLVSSYWADICSWETAFCVLLDTLWHWQPKDPAGCYLWELSFFSLSLNSVLCVVYHCLPCACLYARLMPPY